MSNLKRRITMDKEIIKYRNTLKELFKKYGIHRALRSNTLNDLVDEINEYYTTSESNTITSEQHKQHLKEQLNGWVKYLETEKLKLNSDSEHNQGIIEGFCTVIQLLKDIAER